ncbi:MAG: hypothetical protein ACREMT_07775 [Vulcanimicrobiaceae bacterium]
MKDIERHPLYEVALEEVVRTIPVALLDTKLDDVRELMVLSWLRGETYARHRTKREARAAIIHTISQRSPAVRDIISGVVTNIRTIVSLADKADDEHHDAGSLAVSSFDP